MCRAAVFKHARCTYADFSKADLTAADFSGAALALARLHQATEDHTIWDGADKTLLRGEDPELTEAENWQPSI